MAAHDPTDDTLVAKAGMVSEANRNAIEDEISPSSSA